MKTLDVHVNSGLFIITESWKQSKWPYSTKIGINYWYTHYLIHECQIYYAK